MNEELRKKFDEFIELLDNDEVVIEYKNAKQKYLSDESVMSKINEYNVQTSLLDEENQKKEKDTLLIESLKKRLNELYKEITENKVMQRMTVAEDNLNNIFTQINMGLQSIVDPNACNDNNCEGGCSTCGGCH